MSGFRAAQVISIWGRRGSLAVANVATVDDLVVAFFPLVVVGGLLLGALLARSQGRLTYAAVRTRPFGWLLLITWLLISPVALFAMSILTDQMFLAPRYHVCAAPALAALFALAVRGLGSAPARRIVAAVFAILTLLADGGARSGVLRRRSSAGTPRRPRSCSCTQRSWSRPRSDGSTIPNVSAT